MGTGFHNWRTLLAVGAFSLSGGTAAAQFYGQAPRGGDPEPPLPQNVNFDQRLGNALPLDLELYDHDAQPVRLREVIGAKPSVLVLHYNRCPKLCNEVIQAVLLGLNDARRKDPSFVAGGPFNLVFVSVDPRDAPAAGAKNRHTFHQQYDGRSDDAPGVYFLTASRGQGTDVADADKKVHELAEAVGFRYTLRFRNQDYKYDSEAGKWYDPVGKELPPQPRNYDFQHASGLAVVTPEGTVSKYLLGLTYTPTDLRLALVDASGGRIGTVVDQVLRACYVYDETKGHYKPAMKLLGLAAFPFLLTVPFLAYRSWRAARREAAAAPPAADTAAAG